MADAVAVPPTGLAATPSVTELLDEAPTSRFHRRAVLISGMGFFTDAYDLFIIGTALVLLKDQWHLDANQVSTVGSATLLAAFIGALVFGRIADVAGRKRVYAVVAAVMIAGAVASAFAPSYAWLVASRFVLGLGIGGDYPVSAVLMSEYSNRNDRGRLVSLVFSMQALGLVVGPLVGLTLVASGIDHNVAWRLMLGLGALPAAAVVYLRTRMPESPRFEARVRGEAARAAQQLALFSEGVVQAPAAAPGTVHRMGLARFLTTGWTLRLIAGTAGAWFLVDYAYYGNTISTPLILKDVAPHATLVAKLAWQLGIFTLFAVPGYVLAFSLMDRIGHRRLQALGFVAMALCFGSLWLVPSLTTTVGPFIAVYALSYLFTEFGPNTTTFVLPSEVFPVSMRTTGHGIAAGIGKLGAFVGVFLFPIISAHYHLRGSFLVATAAALAGVVVTFLLPEPSGRSLEEVSGEHRHLVVVPAVAQDQPAGQVAVGAAAPGTGVAAAVLAPVAERA